MITMLWNLLSNTGVNSIITLVSIVISLIALWVACSVKRKAKEYVFRVQKFEFVAIVSELSQLNADFSYQIARTKISQWNKGGAQNERLARLGEIITKMNRYFPLVDKEQQVILKNLLGSLKSDIQKLKGAPVESDFSRFQNAFDTIDQILNASASKIRVDVTKIMLK